MYPSKWTGGTEAEDKSGVATFMVEGVEYALRLDCFADYQVVSEILDAAFKQGKVFAANAMRSHIHNAIEQARRDHAL